MKKRPTEWQQLIRDYHRDNDYIARQKVKWLTPKDKQPKGNDNEKATKKE